MIRAIASRVLRWLLVVAGFALLLWGLWTLVFVQETAAALARRYRGGPEGFEKFEALKGMAAIAFGVLLIAPWAADAWWQQTGKYRAAEQRRTPPAAAHQRTPPPVVRRDRRRGFPVLPPKAPKGNPHGENYGN